MDKNKLNHNADRGSGRQQHLYLNIAFFGVFACAALIFFTDWLFDKNTARQRTQKSRKRNNIN